MKPHLKSISGPSWKRMHASAAVHGVMGAYLAVALALDERAFIHLNRNPTGIVCAGTKKAIKADGLVLRLVDLEPLHCPVLGAEMGACAVRVRTTGHPWWRGSKEGGGTETEQANRGNQTNEG